MLTTLFYRIFYKTLFAEIHVSLAVLVKKNVFIFDKDADRKRQEK